MVFDALLEFDAAGDVDAPGTYLPDRLGDVLGRQPSGEHQPTARGQPLCRRDLRRLAGPAPLVRMVGVDQQIGRRLRPLTRPAWIDPQGRLRILKRAGLQGLERVLPERLQNLRWLIPVKLNEIEVRVLNEGADGLDPFVHHDADKPRALHPELGADRLCDSRGSLRRKITRAPWIEDKAEEVRPSVGGAAGIVEAGDSADLDPGHAATSSPGPAHIPAATRAQALAAGSGAVTSAVPTSIASTPIAWRRATSAGLSMPLSATRTVSLGM